MGAPGAGEIAQAVVNEISLLLKNFSNEMVEHHHKQCHRHASDELYLELIRVTVLVFNLLGLSIMVISTLGVLPGLLAHTIPNMFSSTGDQRKNHNAWLRVRMHLARGLILGMDLMVVSDVIETLMHEVDLIKLFCIIAARSWLSYERTKEFEHMAHEAGDAQETEVNSVENITKKSEMKEPVVKSVQQDVTMVHNNKSQ